MPELVEVQSLVGFLRARAVERTITRVDVVAFNALKTVDPPITALTGSRVTAVERHGKFLDLTCAQEPNAGASPDLHLVIHLARAGWLRWREELPTKPPRAGNGLLALRVHTDDGGFDLTEAGTQKKLAAYLVDDPAAVPGVARLGPDPLDDSFTQGQLDEILTQAGRAQLKGVLTEQNRIAGIGNAYSDEILHAARLSPFKPASGLSAEESTRLYEAIRGTLTDALARSRGLAATELKSEKKTGMAVHGRTGEACGVCQDVIGEVSFADSSLQYCPTCQTGGKPLADRRMSKLLK